MLRNLRLHRPLAFLDLETTGTDPKVDLIVEISVLKVSPDGRSIGRTRRINPGIPIPAEATAVHGISDADVAGEPRFAQVAAGLIALLDDCDLCGFNIKRFDLRVLFAEFSRVGRELPMAGRSIIDPMEIFHSHERRDLSAAVRFYCGREHDGAHGAEADVTATAEVLDAMLDRYQSLPKTVDALHAAFPAPVPRDASGCFAEAEGRLLIQFGKHRGRLLDDVASLHPGYLEWMLGEPFTEDTKAIARSSLRRSRVAVGSGRNMSTEG